MPAGDEPRVNGLVSGVSYTSPDDDRVSIVASAHRALARRLLDYETRKLAADADGLTTATEIVCQKFFKRLARVTSIATCQALLSRALHIPRGEFGFLSGLRAGTKSEPLIEGLRESIEGLDIAYARAGIEVVLGALIGLLESFIGEDLTLNMLREVWPGLPVVTPRRNGVPPAEGKAAPRQHEDRHGC